MGMAIVFEDLVKNMYWRMRGGEKGVDRVMNRWWKAFGYVWVWLYLGWSLPKIRFPEVDCM
jgi:hypothetical protein